MYWFQVGLDEEHEPHLILKAAVCIVVLRTKEHLSGPAPHQEAPCLVRHAPTGREEGDRGSGVHHHRIQRTDSLPFLRCRPWFVAVAHHTGEALAIPAPCDRVRRCQLLALRLRDACIFFQEGGEKINMKMNGLTAGREQKYWKLLPMIQFSGALSIWRQGERNPSLRPEPEFKRSLRELKAT